MDDLLHRRGAAELIERLIAGRSPAEMLFKRDDGRGWKRAEQLRPMRDGCKRAGIGPAVSFHVLRHTRARFPRLTETQAPTDRGAH